MLSSAKESPHGLKQFFWGAHDSLAAQLQHGVSVKQGSEQNAGTVLRQCVLSCAHLACMLVKVYNMLLGGQGKQEQRLLLLHQRQAGAEAAGPAAAAAMLPYEPLSTEASVAAWAAVHAACAALAPANCTVKQLLQQQQLPTTNDPHREESKRGTRAVAVLISQADTRRLVQGLCPALDMLLALHPVANALPVLPFSPKLSRAQVDQAVLQQGWHAQPSVCFRTEQLLSRQGFKHALGCVTYDLFKAAIMRLCEDSQHARAVNAAAARLNKGRNGGVAGLFWGVLELLRVELAAGITSRPQSKAPASLVIRQYVISVAHVANVLVQMHNALLMPRAQPVQQLQQQGHGLAATSAAAAAACGAGGGGDAAAAAGGAAPAQQEQLQGHG